MTFDAKAYLGALYPPGLRLLSDEEIAAELAKIAEKKHAARQARSPRQSPLTQQQVVTQEKAGE